MAVRNDPKPLITEQPRERKFLSWLANPHLRLIKESILCQMHEQIDKHMFPRNHLLSLYTLIITSLNPTDGTSKKAHSPLVITRHWVAWTLHHKTKLNSGLWFNNWPSQIKARRYPIIAVYVCCDMSVHMYVYMHIQPQTRMIIKNHRVKEQGRKVQFIAASGKQKSISKKEKTAPATSNNLFPALRHE